MALPASELPIRGDSALRRSVDLVVAVLALIVLSPLFALVAAAIKLESRGPVFFAQRRVGRGGGSFRILKFRSMVVDASRVGPAISGHKDPRVTRVGEILRATKIDEFPQFWNVLRGEVTLIGPRAEVPEMVAHYSEEERRTLEVRPGLASPGSLHFTTDQAGTLDRVADASAYYVEHQLHEKLALELEYLRRRGFLVDLGIVARALTVMMKALASRR